MKYKFKNKIFAFSILVSSALITACGKQVMKADGTGNLENEPVNLAGLEKKELGKNIQKRDLRDLVRLLRKEFPYNHQTDSHHTYTKSFWTYDKQERRKIIGWGLQHIDTWLSGNNKGGRKLKGILQQAVDSSRRLKKSKNQETEKLNTIAQHIGEAAKFLKKSNKKRAYNELLEAYKLACPGALEAKKKAREAAEKQAAFQNKVQVLQGLFETVLGKREYLAEKQSAFQEARKSLEGFYKKIKSPEKVCQGKNKDLEEAPKEKSNKKVISEGLRETREAIEVLCKKYPPKKQSTYFGGMKRIFVGTSDKEVKEELRGVLYTLQDFFGDKFDENKCNKPLKKQIKRNLWGLKDGRDSVYSGIVDIIADAKKFLRIKKEKKVEKDIDRIILHLKLGFDSFIKKEYNDTVSYFNIAKRIAESSTGQEK